MPFGGGQVEVVGGDERLLYRGAEEAAEKLARTMRDEGLQASLRSSLLPMRDRFTSERFVEGFRRLVGAACP